jgi:hypothetical protein
MTKTENMPPFGSGGKQFWLCIITITQFAVAGNWRTSAFAPAAEKKRL